MVDEPMVDLIADEIAEPVDEADEQVVAPVVGLGGKRGVADGSPHTTSSASGAATECYEVVGPSTAAAEGPSFPHSALGHPVPPSPIKDLSTRLVNLEYGHGQLVKKVIHVSDAEISAGVSIGEISPRVFSIEGQTAIQRDEEIARLTQRVQALQAAV
nr:hypothetical protein [Tanacetum cinerariifolium]